MALTGLNVCIYNPYRVSFFTDHPASQTPSKRNHRLIREALQKKTQVPQSNGK